MLASRLGVAALVVIALTLFIENRPTASLREAAMDIVQTDDADEADTKVTLGPITIDTGGATPEALLEGVQALHEADIIDKDTLVLIERELEQEWQASEEEKLSVEAAGLEIARQLSSRQIAQTDEAQPGRLSEAEIQSLVVQRLLSVQSQSEDDTPGSSNAAKPAALSQSDTQTAAAPSPIAGTAEPELARALLAPEDASRGPLKRIEGSFAGKTLMGADFRNQDLSGLDFSNARLTAAKFDGSDLSGANFSGAKIHGASFANATMDDINLTNSQAQTAHFEGASLVRANLSHANFAGAVLTRADLRGAIMESLNLNGAVMQDIRMGDAP